MGSPTKVRRDWIPDLFDHFDLWDNVGFPEVWEREKVPPSLFFAFTSNTYVI